MCDGEAMVAMVFWVRVAMVVRAKLSLLFGRSWRRGVLFCVVVVAKGRDNENPGGRNLMNIVPGKTNHPFIPTALTGCGGLISGGRFERTGLRVACGLCPGAVGCWIRVGGGATCKTEALLGISFSTILAWHVALFASPSLNTTTWMSDVLVLRTS